jgi:hypothetical protein
LQSLDAAHDAGDDTVATWVEEMRWAIGDEKDPADPPRQHRLVVAHDPVMAQRRSQARRDQMRGLIALGQQSAGGWTPKTPVKAGADLRCRTRAPRLGRITPSNTPTWRT